MNFNKSKYRVLDELKEVFERIDDFEINSVVNKILGAKRIFLIGVGREGLSTRALAMRLMHLGKPSYWVWDDTTPAMGTKDLLLATSGSGEIGHIHYVVEQAKKVGTTTVLATGTPDRKTSILVDAILWIPACVFHGKDDVVPSIQPMGSLFEQALLICFDLIVLKLMDKMDLKTEEIVLRHRNVE